MDMAQTCAVVTGGASGLGEATARHFASQGAKVTLLDRNADLGQQVAQDIGGTFVSTDVTDEQSGKDAIAAAVAAMGTINTVVNCAGIAPAAKTVGREGAHPLDLYQGVITVNLIGSFNIARLAAEHMVSTPPDEDGQRGVIINTASIAAFDGQKGQAAYAASKGGIAASSLPMARDLARDGIRVMAIAPGIFLTPMLMGLPQEVQDNLAKDVTNPRRLGNPKEYARLAQFICECDYLNGETIRLDGGLRMQ